MKNKKTQKMMRKSCMVFALLFAAFAAVRADVDWTQFECSFNVKFPGYRGATTLTDFPVLVRLSAELNGFEYSKCRVANGGDLRFADANGNLLASEVDTWNVDGTSLVWVKVPALNKNTTIKAYYGCATPPAVAASDVWDNGYVGVWHLGAANSTTQTDSTTNQLDFICAAGDVGKVDLAVSSGAVGGAVGFNRDDTKKGGLSVSDSSDVLAGSDDLTLEAWIYPMQIDTSAQRGILSKRASTSSATYYVYANKDREGTPTISPSKGPDDSASAYPGAKTDPPPLNSWTHTVFTRIGSTREIKEYLDGTNLLSITQSCTAGGLYRGGYTVVLGNDKTTSASSFPGNIDEVRISSVARSAEWIQATRDTVANEVFAAYEVDNDWEKYSHSFTVSFPGGPANATLANFPVLVKIAEYDENAGAGIQGFSYADCLKANGGDLRFADADGNLLASEVDTWDVTGTSLVWVKVPTLNKDTTIKAYYGCSIPPVVMASDVWDNGYVGVWHLGAANDTTQKDSTTNQLDFICADGDVGMVDLAVSSGAVGGAVGFSRDETKKGGLSVSDSSDVLAGSDDLTLEAWIYPTQIDTANNRAILSKRASTSTVTYYVYTNSSREGTPTIAVSKGADDPSATYPGAKTDAPPLNSWTHTAFTRVGSTMAVKEYLDGTNLVSATQSGTAGSLYRGGYTVVLGNDKTTAASSFPGNIDEVRISKVARSAEWIKATRDTIKDNANFTTYGVVRETTRGGLVIIVR